MSFDSQPWTEPGPHEVAPGVHRIPLPMPNDGLRAVNVYAIEDGDGVVLIDAGWEVDDAREQLRAALDALGYGLADIRRFLVTHMHRDHYTLAVALRRVNGTPIALGAGERPSLEEIIHGSDDRQIGELRRWGADGRIAIEEIGIEPERGRTIYELPDEWLTGVSDIELTKRTLRAVPTPGHTHGHMVFIDEQASLLFAGDHVLPHITPSIGFEPAQARLPLGDYLASLRLMLSHPDMLLLPAHGPVVDSAHARVRELLDHHDERLEVTWETVRDGATTAFESAAMLGWTRRHRDFADLNAFNQFLAVGETSAHLDVLAEQRRLAVSVRDGVARYGLADAA
ncbi:MAG: MBL fold metallo-hydrolase [Haloechinothrix sp.]